MMDQGEAGLETEIRESDVLAIALPNTHETKHLKNSKRFLGVKKTQSRSMPDAAK
jgi:lactate dehydrogenase-like 2-hydroxyacid dehydrogenase